MYKGYTNLELYDLFRHPSNKKLHKFPEFLDSLTEKVCQNHKMKSLLSESEITITDDLVCNLLQTSMASSDSQSEELTSQSMNFTQTPEQISSTPCSLSDELLDLENPMDVQD